MPLKLRTLRDWVPGCAMSCNCVSEVEREEREGGFVGELMVQVVIGELQQDG